MNLSIYFVGLFAISCYAALSPIAKKITLGGIPPFPFMAFTMLCLALYAGIAACFRNKDFLIATVTPAQWLGILAFSLVNFIGFGTYLYVITKIPVTEYQLLGLIGPIVGGIIAYFMLGEAIKPQYFAGLMLMGAGLFVALRDWS